MNLTERTLSYLQERKDKISNGGINSIPSPFQRFSSDFIGVEQGKYVCVTASTKGAKTQFASYMFIYTPLLYAYEHPDQVRVRVFYYPLEETPEDIMKRFMSHLLYKLSKGRIRVSVTDLQSSRNDMPVDQSILDTLKQEEYMKILKYFEEHIQFSTSRNPTGVYNEVKRYMEENGTVHTRKQKIKDDFGNTKEIDAFDYYEPNDPGEYVIVFCDHASLIQIERGMTLKQSVDKLSEYFVILRNRYNVTPVLVQQQAFSQESLENYKEKRLRPDSQGLADSKYSARDCNVLLGLFSPFRFELKEYLGYDIAKFRDNIRFLEVILNRGGVAGGIVALFFDGAVCDFVELPLPDNKNALDKVYSYLQTIRNPFKKASVSMFIKKLVKHLFK